MLSRPTLCVLAVLAFFAPADVCAQDGPKIAVVNPAKVFNDMQETKDLKQKMESDRKAITDEGQRRQAELKDAENKRRLFNEGTEDFNKANKEYLEKVMAAQVWQELIKADLNRQQKSQMKNLFDKIEQATKEVAEAKKLDIVIIEQKVEVPAEALDQINVDQLRNLINQRSVMYNNGKFDITEEVLKAVDAKYKARK